MTERPFREHTRVVSDYVQNFSGMPRVARRATLGVLDSMAALAEVMEAAGIEPRADGRDGIAALAEEVVALIDHAQTPSPVSRFVDWIISLGERTAKEFSTYSGIADPVLVSHIRGAIEAARDANEIVASQEETAKALAESERAVALAQRAAHREGATSLAGALSTYAKSEQLAARGFRWAAIAGIVVSILIAALWQVVAAHLENLGAEPELDPWQSLVHRAIVVAGIAGLSAYLARQSGQHRRLANWAAALAVQLDAFPAFIETVPEDVRAETYRDFSRRVLGSPPESGKESSDEVVTSAQLLDLVTAVVKQNR